MKMPSMLSCAHDPSPNCLPMINPHPLLIGSASGYFAVTRVSTAHAVLTTWLFSLCTYSSVSHDLKLSPHPPSAICLLRRNAQALRTLGEFAWDSPARARDSIANTASHGKKDIGQWSGAGSGEGVRRAYW